MAERDSLGKLRTLSIEEMDTYNQRIGALYKELQPAHICFVSDYIGTEVGAFFFFYYPENYYPAEIYAKLLASVDEGYRHKSELKKEKEKEAAAHWKESVNNRGRLSLSRLCLHGYRGEGCEPFGLYSPGSCDFG